MKARILLISIIFLIHWFPTQSQNTTDSLIQIIKSEKPDTVRLEALIDLSFQNILINPDSALNLIDSSQNWARRIQNPQLIGEAKKNKSIYYWYKNNLPTAYDSLLEVYHFSVKNKLTRLQINSASNLAALCNMMDKTEEAFHYLIEGIEGYKQLGDSAKLAKCQLDLGQYYLNTGDLSKALQSTLNAAAYFEEHKDYMALTYTYATVGICYHRLNNGEKALYFYHKSIENDKKSDQVDYQISNDLHIGLLFDEVFNNMDSALYYYDKVDKRLEKYPEDLHTHLSLSINRGNVYYKNAKYGKALSIFLEALKNPCIRDRNSDYIIANLNTGFSYYQLKQIDSAIQYTKTALDTAKKYHLHRYEIMAHHNLFKIDSARHAFTEAIRNLQRAQHINDSLMSEESKIKIQELTSNYELSEKEKELQVAEEKNKLNEKIIENQRKLNYVEITVLIIVVFFMIYYYLSRKKLREKNSELQKQKEKLNELNTTKDRFFSIIAHDLKSPFNSLLGFSEILNNKSIVLSDDEMEDIHRNLHSTSKSTFNLIINLLDWSRTQRMKIKPEADEIRIDPLITDIKNLYRSQLEDKNLKFIFDAPDHLSFVSDPNLLRTILTNLIGNSIKFTPEHGTISVSVKKLNNKIRFHVKDTGIGIPADKIEEIFNLDNKFQRSGTNNETGTGLGLIICKEFADLLKGSLHVESKVGKGSTIILEIPG